MYSKQDVSQYSGFSGPEGPSPMKTSSNPDKIQLHYQLKGVGWIGHINRMTSNAIFRVAMRWTPVGKKKTGGLN